MIAAADACRRRLYVEGRRPARHALREASTRLVNVYLNLKLGDRILHRITACTRLVSAGLVSHTGSARLSVQGLVAMECHLHHGW